MAWNQPGGNNQDPWGGGNRGGGNQGPPDLDEAIKKFQEKINRWFGGSGGGGGRGGVNIAVIGVILAVVVVVCFVAGIKIINEQERGVVLRFGNYDRTLNPGFNWAPPLIDRVDVVNVTRVRFHNVSRSTMLTEDLNIVEVDISVQYVISDAQDFVLNIRAPEQSLKEATDSALRHEVGSMEMDRVLTEGRNELAVNVEQRLQSYLDSYGAGILLRTVSVEETSPPDAVQDAFDDVNRAREDEERAKNEAQAYANNIIPRARGAAQRTIEEANGYRTQVIARAEGQASRFEQLLTEYQQAPEVTRERLYVDTVQEVMSNSSKVMVDVENGNNLMYLPLDKMMNKSSSGSASSGSGGMSSSDIAAMEQRVLERLRSEMSNNNSRRR